MDKKTILIIEPFEKMSRALIEGVHNLGYNVVSLFEGKMKSFDYSKSSTFDKLKNIFHRTVLGNTNYYHVLLEKFYQKYTEELLEKIIKDGVQIDYALVIRPHGFSIEFYKTLNKLTPNISLYEYDGLHGSRDLVLNKIKKYAKNTFLFDYNDLDKVSGAKFITNYHYNFTADKDIKLNVDFYYLGLYGKERLENLHALISARPGKNKKFILQTSNNALKSDENIIFITHSKDYTEYLDEIKNTKSIIDLKSSIHDGLSFRFFEALNLRKKLITNNPSVKNYNFYHPDNIYITDFKNFEGLDEFMEKPYHPIPEDIVHLYSLENWIKNIFQMDGYQPIPLPNIKTR